MNMSETPPRWATRREAMAYGRIGSTKLHELMRSRRILAKKLDGRKVHVDLNSIDALYTAMPEVADA
jgi:hypothetical protein